MALLTIPAVTKGTPATITLDKTTLFAISAVAADAYFSVQGNVDKCIIEYRSSPGKQKRRLVFDLSDPSPTASFLVSAKARSSFVISKIILVDFVSDTLSVPSAQIPSGLGITANAQ